MVSARTLSDSPPGATDAAAWAMTVAVLLASVSILVVLFWETASDGVLLWTRSAYNYCYLILPISLYLVWERRHAIAPLRPRPTLWGLVLASGCLVLWVAAEAATVTEVAQFALVGLIQSLLLTLLGWRVAAALALPILYLLLMVPTGERILPLLQFIATEQSVFWISLSGIPIYHEGIIIYVPSGTYRVATVCSGLNFLLSATALSLVYGNLMYQGIVKRIACVAIMAAVAIVGNGIRIYGIIVINHYYGANIDIVDDHYVYGWGFIAVVLLAMMMIGLAFRDPEQDIRARPADTRGGPPLPRLGLQGALAAVALLSVAAFAPLYVSHAMSEADAPATVQLSLPESIGAWRRTAADRDGWLPSFPGAHLQVKETYRNDGQSIDIFIAYFAHQSASHELVFYNNEVTNESTWPVIAERSRTLSVEGESMAAVEYWLQRSTAKRTVWGWYWVDGRLTNSESWAKLLQAKTMLLGGERRAAFIALSAQQDADPAETNRMLQNFVDSMKSPARILESARIAPVPAR